MKDKREPPQPKQRQYEFCPQCNTRTEVCQYFRHRGINHCMDCGGGVGSVLERYCFNCLDLPFREKREKLYGEEIVYTSEKKDG